MTAQPATAVLIVAAGRGHRFGGDMPKQYMPLQGAAVLTHTLRAFLRHPDVAQVITAIHPDDRELYDAATAPLGTQPKLLAPVHGGAERQDSVRMGLEALAAHGPAKVLIQDGARPLASAGLITRVVSALDTHAAALPCVAVTDTLKRVADGMVGDTVDRTGLARAQTPQGFRFAEIMAAHKAVAGEALTDDAAVAERAGMAIALVEGAEDNLKITTQDDLVRAEGLLSLRLGDIRTGSGFDVHKFDAPGTASEIMLCGIPVPHDCDTVGHSDADVGLHALTDALLGAIGAGDIGEHFPPSDPQWKGAASWKFLAHAAGLVRERGGVIASADITIICERPKVGPYRPAMRARVAEILEITEERVSVKATTTEQLGFTGRREGIAAQSVATVRLPL
ncbi:bifunctional 2-C-methyl-D-erythritol 4-phosphate cytidylyltransferase/2-C-methyl-D-erythritol 2,4-cyclodiphosphate synthase [Pyruvatibacter mobilis]|uniref:bifunctional 2-C-methyl-D-erythritol 4-phosphate cytidylyltransferase/2-C-methyl-D-erythritol 2,4-cyclodiphosphate synthase n=1 Tax=Pyruvatibacter mobilis TaxID=1712261 RepID=UPI003BABA493